MLNTPFMGGYVYRKAFGWAPRGHPYHRHLVSLCVHVRGYVVGDYTMLTILTAMNMTLL